MALLQDPPEMDSGPKVRVSGRKSELRTKKVRVTAGQTPRIRTESPEIAPNGVSAENPP